MVRGFSRSFSVNAGRASTALAADAVAARQEIFASVRYDRVAIALHWSMAAVLVAQFALGWWMLNLPDQGGVQRFWFNLHKSLGIALAGLALFRLGWRTLHPAPPLPVSLPRLQRLAAHVTHAGLYVCILGLPLTGYLGSSFSGYPVRFFGYALPAWGWKSPEAKAILSSLHLTLTWLLAALVVLHVAAGLHHLLQRDGMFQRMWPLRRNARRFSESIEPKRTEAS